jgi:predicted Zn-dependent peptidase
MPILGTRESVEALTLQDLQKYRRAMYVPERMVVSVAGGFDRRQVMDTVVRKFGDARPGKVQTAAHPISYQASRVFEEREMEQTHLCFALPALPTRHEHFWTLNMLNNALGGCSSSRLFRRIREELGMAYSVDSAWTSYEQGGLLYIQAAVSPEQAERAATEIVRVLQSARNGLSESEFRRAREWLRSSVRMDWEDSMHRATIAAEDALVHGMEPDEVVLKKIDAVTRDDVNRLAAGLFDLNQLSVSVCGDIPHPEFYEKLSAE